MEHNFSIAGIDFGFSILDPSIPEDFRYGYDLFRTPPSRSEQAQYQIDLIEHFDYPEINMDRLLWDSPNWRLGPTRDGRLFFDVNLYPENVKKPIAVLEPDFSSGTLFYYPMHEGVQYTCPLRWPADEQIMLNRIAHFGGALIHCCGILYEGKALLFCGKSGAGKSTTAEIWKRNGFTVLNDDRIVVRMLDGVAVAAATPWHGTMREIHPEMVPLGGVFHLIQAQENRTHPVEFQQGVTRLMANAIAPHYHEEHLANTVGACGDVLEAAPSFDLEFTPDEGAMEAVMAALVG